MSWLTLGALRAMTEHLPDDTPLTVSGQGVEGLSSWYNLELLEECVASYADGDSPSVILELVDDFDTRQW